jgi:hypothetical protein
MYLCLNGLEEHFAMPIYADYEAPADIAFKILRPGAGQQLGS